MRSNSKFTGLSGGICENLLLLGNDRTALLDHLLFRTLTISVPFQ